MQERVKGGAFFAEGYVCELSEGGRMASVRLLAVGGDLPCGASLPESFASCAGSTSTTSFPASCTGSPRCSCAGGGCFILATEGGETLVLAENPIAALPGQRVILDARRGLRLSASGLIFFLPLLIFFAAYASGSSLFNGHELAPFCFAAAAAVLYYLLLYFAEKRRTKTIAAHPIWIARVVADAPPSG